MTEKQIALPDGEKLILTIDREVERECDDCDANGYYSDPSTCPYPSYWHPEYTCRSECDEGKRKVRVRGHVEVDTFIRTDAETDEVVGHGITVWPEIPEYSVYHDATVTATCDEEAAANVLRDIIIAAWRDDTLPDGVAHIVEQEVE